MLLSVLAKKMMSEDTRWDKGDTGNQRRVTMMTMIIYDDMIWWDVSMMTRWQCDKRQNTKNAKKPMVSYYFLKRTYKLNCKTRSNLMLLAKHGRHSPLACAAIIYSTGSMWRTWKANHDMIMTASTCNQDEKKRHLVAPAGVQERNYDKLVSSWRATDKHCTRWWAPRDRAFNEWKSRSTRISSNRHNNR